MKKCFVGSIVLALVLLLSACVQANEAAQLMVTPSTTVTNHHSLEPGKVS